MSQLDQVAPGGVVQLNNAPAALDDATFDSLFPAESNSQAVQSVQQVTQPAGTQATQQTTQTQPVATQTQPDAPYLKGNSSVYKTSEAAIEGINQKDALIEQLRQRYALTTGIDPITGQPVGQGAAPAVNENDYYDNPDRYLQDLYKAAKSTDPSAYRDVQAKFVYDSLKPLQPVVQQAARTQALAAAATDNPEVAKFVGTPAYQKTLDANPDLKGAVTTAEQDYRWHARLPGLYKLAYLTGQGMQLPELLKAQTSQTQTTQTQQPRTTVQPVTSTLPRTSSAQPNMRTIDGIRAIIAEQEAKGAKLDF